LRVACYRVAVVVAAAAPLLPLHDCQSHEMSLEELAKTFEATMGVTGVDPDVMAGLLKRYDVNGDGSITFAEVAASAPACVGRRWRAV
jgi:hypothetical protein